MSGWLTFGGSNARPGSTAASIGALRQSWFDPLVGSSTTQPLVARNVPRAGDTTVYVETAAGFVYALAADGYVRWRVDLGRLTFDPCQVIPDGFGVTGTPVIDPSTRTLYVVDAFGRLHALDLATGAERPGWPVVLYDDPKKELDWGALLLADGSVYVGTGSYCDLPMEGKLIRVELATRKVSVWEAVPPSLGGGGSVWGWGGPAYSAKRDSIYVVTGNAFEGGTNKGASFSEEAGYGEHLVELSPDLNVRSSDAPPLAGFTDVDYVGSPVIVDTKDCGELVAAQAKNGMFFGWRADAVSSGPVWALKLQKADAGAPLLTQPTWSPQLRSFYVATASKLVRIVLGANCQARMTWQTPLGQSTLYPSPTVAGSTVWVALPVKDLSGVNESLLGVDAKTGRVLVRKPIAGVSFAPPAALPGMLFLATMHGLGSIRFPVAHGRPSSLPEYTSRLDAKHTWQSREDGVYSTDDGGRHWKRIYSSFAARVDRTSATSGVISVGAPAPACGCSTQRLWTSDGGRTWKVARGIGEDFEGSGSTLYWWSGSSLFLASPGYATSKKIATADGPIVDAAALAGGAAVLVDRRSKPPEVIVAHGSSTQTVTLPAGPPAAVVRSIAASGSTVVVTGRDYTSPATGPDPTLSWHSHDGGETWTLGS